MKFTIAVVVLALAVAAQASVIPLVWAGHHHGAIDAHHLHHHGDDGSWHGDNAWEDGHWDPSHDLVHDHHDHDDHYAHGLGLHAAVVAGHHGLVAGHHGLLGHHVVAGHHGLPVVAAHHAHAHEG